jgi:hypothetical protein
VKLENSRTSANPLLLSAEHSKNLVETPLARQSAGEGEGQDGMVSPLLFMLRQIPSANKRNHSHHSFPNCTTLINDSPLKSNLLPDQ